METDDSSNDVVAIRSDDEEEIYNSEKPIIQLFRRLVTNNSKQSTVLTNTQIVDILNKELNVNICGLNELEGEIYLTIMKKYLKDWPQWDEFDRVFSELKNENKDGDIEKIFEAKYVNLKSYLKTMLGNAQSLAKSTIQKALETKNEIIKKNNKHSSGKNVVLEIHASRNQLNQLFFRQPNSKLNNTIFNSTYSLPTQIQLKMLPLEAILNWWGVNISLLNVTNAWLYKREIKHELKHILVNKNLTTRLNSVTALDQDIKVSNYQRNGNKIDTSVFLNLIDKIASKSPPDWGDIYEFIKKDIKMLPDTIHSRVTYKRYTNKYSYIRYLYINTYTVEDEFKHLDLQLEETVSPSYHTFFGQIYDSNPVLIVECGPCALKFTSQNLVHDLINHFNEHHQNEPDWKCINCKKKFTMATLAINWWCHRC